MPVEIPKTPYSGKIREITLGKGPKAVRVGGETAYPFYLFEGKCLIAQDSYGSFR